MAPILHIMFYLVFCNIKSSSILLLNNKTVFNFQTQTRISNTVQKYFIYENTLGLLLFDGSVDDIFSQKLHLPFVTYSKEKLIENCGKIVNLDGYVFVISEESLLQTQVIEALQCYNKTTLKLNTKKILIIANTSLSWNKKKDDDFYLEYFHLLWSKFGLIHAIIFTMYGNENEILAYNPFTSNELKPGCLLKYDIGDDFVLGLNKRFYNMHGYTLNGIIYPFNLSVHTLMMNEPQSIRGGPELTFRWAVQSYFNVRFYTHRSRDNQFNGFIVNGTPTGALADIINNYVDIAFNLKILKWYNSPKVQFLIPRMYSPLVVMVEKKGRIHGWKMILHVFQWKIWSLIVCTIVFTSVFLTLIVKFRSKIDFNPPGQVNLFSVMSMSLVLKSTLSISILKVPRYDSERMILAACLWFGLVIICVFSGQLFYLTKTKPQLANINSLKELQDSGLQIFTPYGNFMDAFDGLQNTSLRKLKERLKYKSYNCAGCFNYPTRIDPNSALVYSGSMMEYLAIVEPTEFFKKVHFLREHISELPLGLMMPIGSIFYEHFNKFSVRLFQLGFFNKWTAEYLSLSREQSYRYHRSTNFSSEDDFDVLSVNDLGLSFSILGVGLVLATVTFLLEICVKNYLPLLPPATHSSQIGNNQSNPIVV